MAIEGQKAITKLIIEASEVYGLILEIIVRHNLSKDAANKLEEKAKSVA